jgi:hypothetical protein
MMTPEADVEAHALRKQGWTISAIAQHLDRDRKTVVPASTVSASPASAAARRTTRSMSWPTTSATTPR